MVSCKKWLHSFGSCKFVYIMLLLDPSIAYCHWTMCWVRATDHMLWKLAEILCSTVLTLQYFLLKDISHKALWKFLYHYTFSGSVLWIRQNKWVLLSKWFIEGDIWRPIELVIYREFRIDLTLKNFIEVIYSK